MSTPTESDFISDLELLLNTHSYGLPKWIGGGKYIKLIELSKDVYNIYKTSKIIKNPKSFFKICKILFNNLERKLTYPKPSYYIIKTFHFIYIFLKHLPRITIFFITGKKSLYSTITALLNTFYKRIGGNCLFYENITNHSNASAVASITYEFLRLSNFIIKQLFFYKIENENIFESAEKNIYSRFINNFSKIKFFKNLIFFYSLSDFQYEKSNFMEKIIYKNEKYYDAVSDIITNTLHPPPPYYELRSLLFEFLDTVANLTELDRNPKNKRFWIVQRPTCKIIDGSLKVFNKDRVKSKFKHTRGIFGLVDLALKFIDADLLTITCSSLRYFYGQYYLYFPSLVMETSKTSSCVSLGSRLNIDPKLAATVVYKLQLIALNILSRLDKSVIKLYIDKLINLAWYYASAEEEQEFPDSNINLNYCCGGLESTFKCTDTPDFDIISTLKILSQTVDDFSITNPYPTKFDLVHIQIESDEINRKTASLQDHVNFSVSTDFWIMNNKICNKYIAPKLNLRPIRRLAYPNMPDPASKCNMFCIYNKHLYRNISWLHTNTITMPTSYRQQLVTTILSILAQNMINKNDNTVSGFYLAEQ